MSVLSFTRSVIGRQIINSLTTNALVSCQVQSTRQKFYLVRLPKPGNGQAFRRIVHYEDEYTVRPLDVTNLAGRDPVTGRVVAKGIGGGIKHKFHWIKWTRDGPTDLEEPPKQEKVLDIIKDGNRTAFVALVGCGKELKYILATENMKVGDILRTHRGLPTSPHRVNEGDAFPVGAMPVGTSIHCVEKFPGGIPIMIHAAGTCGHILRHNEHTREVTIKMPSKRQFILHPACMATVGRLSNVEHDSTPIGSAQKSRELGNRPRSGLWQRKTGRFGRRIKRERGPELQSPPKPSNMKYLSLDPDAYFP